MKKILLSVLAVLFLALPTYAVDYPIGLTPQTVVTAGDMSLASITGPTITIIGLDNISVQASWTGTPTGTFSVQVSDDSTTWTTLNISPAPVASGAAGNLEINLNQIAAAYVRVVYTRTASSGTLTVLMFGKHI